MTSRGTLRHVVALLGCLLAAASCGAEILAKDGSIFVTTQRGCTARFNAGNGSLRALSAARGSMLSVHRETALWSIDLVDGRTIESWNFSSTNEKRKFAYATRRRDAADELVLSYSWADDGPDFNVMVTLSFDDDAPRVVSRFAYIPREDAPLGTVRFPAHVAFDSDALRQAVVPHRNGIVLTEKFFDKPRQYVGDYPSLFTNFVWFETKDDTLAIFTPLRDHPPMDRRTTMVIANDGGSNRSRNPITHYRNELRLEKDASAESFVSEDVVWYVGKTAVESAQQHWREGASRKFPTLRDKLKGKADAVSRSVLVKYPLWRDDASTLKQRSLLAQVPHPAILHLAAYMRGGHDSHYPDYLPPEAKFGTTEDLAAFARDARAHGHMVMPYTNPTWWQEDSETMQALGEDVIARDEHGSLRREKYGERSGVVVSPSHPLVKKRLLETYEDFRTRVPSDLLFEDQVGARGWMYDGNASEQHPFAYNHRLAENATVAAAHLPLYVEGGWDRIAESAAGMCGNMLLDWEQPKLPDDCWRPYPLAQVMAGAQVAFYAHNLAPEAMVHDRRTLIHNLALGYEMSYDLILGNMEQLNRVAEIQRMVRGAAFGQRIIRLDDERATTGVTRLVYDGGVEIIANWSEKTVTEGDAQISGEGLLFRVAKENIIGGLGVKMLPDSSGPPHKEMFFDEDFLQGK